MKKYLSAFFILIVLITAVIALMAKNDGEQITFLRWMILLYFSVLTLAFHIGLVRSTRSRPAVFVRYYMATTTLKLFMHMGVLVIYCLFHRAMAMPFIISFMVAYFLFTAFEVAMNFKKESGVKNQESR